MIYLKPTSIEEALEGFQQESASGKQPLWYSGGTEVITFLRKGTLSSDALIDLKGIPQYRILESTAEGWLIGAGVPLNTLLDTSLPEPLTACIAPIADRTVRNRLSLGGNLCGRLPYKEALLPLLALDASVDIASSQGIERIPLREQFKRNLGLSPNQFLLRIWIPKPLTETAWGSSRKVRLGSVDYPVVHVLITGKQDHRNLFVSGLCPYPVSLYNLTDVQLLSSPSQLPLPSPPQEDRLASKAYRLQLFKLAIREALEQIGGTL